MIIPRLTYRLRYSELFAFKKTQDAMKNTLLSVLLFLSLLTAAIAQQTLTLANDRVSVDWRQSDTGWQVSKLAIKTVNGWTEIPHTSGEYTLLYAKEKPADQPEELFKTPQGDPFPGEVYKYVAPTWTKRTRPVNLNTAGTPFHFFPTEAEKLDDNRILFKAETEFGSLSCLWELDQLEKGDLLVSVDFQSGVSGYVSLSSPSLYHVEEDEMKWVTVPGYFHGNKLEENLARTYGYGIGVPNRPIVFSENTASTLSPIISMKSGISGAIVPDISLGRNPWENDQNTHSDWELGLSHMNRRGQLSPTLYYPILGETGSRVEEGNKIRLPFRITMQEGDWFSVLNHVVYDIFGFGESLVLRQNKRSLSDRVAAMHGYLMDPITSLWRTEQFEGREIGAQAYLGGVVGADRDAMKNADYGAMWMLAKATPDSELNSAILPYALNFKLAQQQTTDGFFKGAAIGQYYLSKSEKFVEEWGDMVEPIGLTYYIMLDIGNILLFEPDQAELKERLRLGAELLMKWQKPDGSWAVAYRRDGQEIFNEVEDYRPTFYGLLVAHRVLGDKKYLEAAKKGADWFIEKGIETGSYLGVCGDVRYMPDFATGQTAQALLDLYDATQNQRYLDASIKAAKQYTTHIYTHPIPTREIKNVGGKLVYDWQISQTGLSFEHGGALGSANSSGPILLASHAGMFVRMYQLTHEKIFIDMARAAAVGRDAFVNQETQVASYYWRSMDAGSGPFPHHAWWQIGWITDYLMAEASMRSNGKIAFPRGFITPKVGPHQSYGFAPGEVFGVTSDLRILTKGQKIDNPSIESIAAISQSGKMLQLILMNGQTVAQSAQIELNLKEAGFSGKIRKAQLLNHEGKSVAEYTGQDSWKVEIEGYGLSVLKIEIGD